GRAPLIGREQELQLLLGIANRALESRDPQLVTLVGVPGIGKSRLTFELHEAVSVGDTVAWRQGRCLPYGDGVAFWAMGEIVKSRARIFESDSAERAEQKLLASIDATVGDDRDREWVGRHLRTLVGIGSDGAAVTQDPQDDAFAAWRRFVEGLADERPLVLV